MRGFMLGRLDKKARWEAWRGPESRHREVGRAWAGDAWPSHGWAAVLGVAVVVGCVYFLAARLSLALLSKAEGVAVFWPASGVATGALMVLGGRARVCVAVAIFGATLAANLLGDRGVFAAICFGVCNAGEALLAAWLADRWSGRGFRFESLRGLWGFFAAAVLAAATAAAGAAMALQQFHGTEASLLSIWRIWATADAIGIIAIAPLVVGLHDLAGAWTSRDETVEAATALGLLAAAAVAVYAAPVSPWMSHVPAAALFPFLLWIAARCRPVFAAAAACIVSGVLLGAAILHLGPFAGAEIPVVSVQVTMLIASLCALTLSALFTERRSSEAALLESNERLQLALGGAQLGVWSADLATGALECDERHCRINGHDPLAPPLTLAHARTFVHPDDLTRLDAAFAAARRTGAPCQAEYRVSMGDGIEPGEARWVAVEGSVACDAAGRPVRLLGVTRDITGRKRAEEQKDLLLAELDHRVKNALAVVAAVASRTHDAGGSVTDFVAALDGRIKSMATTHDLLSGRKWEGLPLRDLVERELQPYATGSNVHIAGSDAVLRAEAGQALAMVVHELVTNAAKYGALSVERGCVSVRWTQAPANGAEAAPLVLDWVEMGGPPVAAGARRGYGTSVIRDLIPYEVGGSVDLNLAPGGVRCRLQVPARWLSAASPPQRGANGAGTSSTAAAPRGDEAGDPVKRPGGQDAVRDRRATGTGAWREE
jgi:PAS domain S-box-containing protein